MARQWVEYALVHKETGEIAGFGHQDDMETPMIPDPKLVEAQIARDNDGW